MVRVLIILLATSPVLGACATLTGSAHPACNGGSRRPLNRSLWDWEGQGAVATATPPAATATPQDEEPLMRKSEGAPAGARVVESTRSLRPAHGARVAAGPAIDVAGSFRSCAS